MSAQASVQKFFTRIVSQTNSKATGSVIFLHGSGDTGIGIQNWLDKIYGKQFSFPHLRVLYPTAPPRPYSPYGGALSTVWYDRSQIRPSSPDCRSVDHMCQELSSLIEAEMESGIPINRIVIGGFSMGGGMALQLSYRFHRNLAGVFALSSFLAAESRVYDALRSEPNPAPALFMAHGQRDDLVSYQWGKDTFDQLTLLQVPGEFHPYANLAHELSNAAVVQLHDWIQKMIPQEDTVHKL